MAPLRLARQGWVMHHTRTIAWMGWVLATLACQSPNRPEPADDAGHGHDAAVLADAGGQLDAGRDAAALLDAAPPPHDAAPDTTPEPSVEEICGTRTMYPELTVIDPDDPTYSDATWTNEEVRAEFAAARDGDTDAYRAYRTAHARPDLMYCGFCPCGCSASIGHESGIDCFKDMHGFG